MKLYKNHWITVAKDFLTEWEEEGRDEEFDYENWACEYFDDYTDIIYDTEGMTYTPEEIWWDDPMITELYTT